MAIFYPRLAVAERRVPPAAAAPTGPEIRERLLDFSLCRRAVTKMGATEEAFLIRSLAEDELVRILCMGHSAWNLTSADPAGSQDCFFGKKDIVAGGDIFPFFARALGAINIHCNMQRSAILREKIEHRWPHTHTHTYSPQWLKE